MSYYASFKPTEEAMKKYNVRSNQHGHLGNIKEDKLALVVYALQSPKRENIMKEVKEAVWAIKMALAGIQMHVERDEKQLAYDRWKEDENHHMWYCGWQYSHDVCDHTQDEVYDYVIDRLITIMFCSKDSTYFDEGEEFNKKWKEVSELVDYFEEATADVIRYQIMDDLNEFRIKNEGE